MLQLYYGTRISPSAYLFTEDTLVDTRQKLATCRLLFEMWESALCGFGLNDPLQLWSKYDPIIINSHFVLP